MIISLYLVSTILSQWLDPRHTEMEMNKKLFSLSQKVDSLSDQVDKKELLIKNIQSMVSGEAVAPTIQRDSLNNDVSFNDLNKEIDLSQIAPADSQFRKDFEASGLELISNNKIRDIELQEMFFFDPVEGAIISSPYNAKEDHFGIDIVAKKNEPVKSIANGTVIMADNNLDDGYVIAIQHSSNLLSIYKHNSALLKKVGNFVTAGEIISIMGNTGNLSSAPHLHFEIWYNGNPVNPEDFVSF
ncbi:M23 family metallopeptidase [Fulvivirgaceae bacterium BMA12]|uniref:M23 family metallopeptidase n=2 Tax=Agaribacillus aureus TaxID=3051825 RepID=A0ABT8L4L3_9BACT|nr:M23 family metallopeptidase [Fulvivirgaceae bacterium BMA12]